MSSCLLQKVQKVTPTYFRARTEALNFKEKKMMITGKSLKTLTKLFALAADEERVRFAVRFDNFVDSAIVIGFENKSVNGDSLIPSIIGKVTSKNAIGAERTRKDLGLQKESISFFTSWKDWHGQSHSGVQIREVEKYPREYIKAQEERLHIIESDTGRYISTKELLLSESNKIEVLHLANLMLESFGEFELLDSTNNLINPPGFRQLHWDIFPPGEYPWFKAKGLVGEITKNLKDSERAVVECRMEALSRYTPDFLATGRAGFNGYFVFGRGQHARGAVDFGGVGGCIRVDDCAQ